MTVVPGFYEDEDPESVGSIRLMLEEAIGKLANFAAITDYQIEQVPLPNVARLTRLIFLSRRKRRFMPFWKSIKKTARPIPTSLNSCWKWANGNER